MEPIRCCKCNQEVRMPDDLTAIWVRCPHCAADYQLREILAQLPPALVVIPPPLVDVMAPGENSPIEDLDTEISDADDAPLDQTTARTGVLIDPASDQKVFVRSPQNLEANRKKAMTRRTKNSAVKVVLGGVAGLMIGQLVLWWLPQPYRTDPLSIAPALPKFMAFLAPASLQNDPPDLILEGLRRANDGESEPQAVLDDASGTESAGSEQAQQSVEVPEPPTAGGYGRPTEPVLGLASVPRIGMQELQDSLKRATTAVDQFSGLTSNGGFAVIYQDLSQLAFNITFADVQEPNINRFERNARALLGKLAADRLWLDGIGIAATGQVQSPHDSDRQGILVTGRVKSVAPAGQLFRTHVEASGSQSQLVAVVSRRDPQKLGAFAQNDLVLIAGVVVNDPSLQLLGYEGSDDVVVLGGLPIKIPE